jgi:DNA-binding response OmpR family regulator
VKVLIAEDDTVSRLVLQRAVERCGHECVAARDGDEAWAAYLAHAPDVVLSDRVMPGMDGLELCRRIRAHAVGKSYVNGYTYLILLSVLSERDHVLSGIQAGADDYLAKPLDPDDLLVRLEVAGRVTALHRTLARQKRELERLLGEQEKLTAALSEAAEARGRLAGVSLAAREMAHLLSNDLAVAVGIVDLLQGRPGLPPDVVEMLGEAARGLAAADDHLRQFQNVVRVETKETPVGPALDLARSTRASRRRDDTVH